MRILFKERIIFTHVPKTAGTSIASALGRRIDGSFSLSHFTPDEAIREIFQESWSDFYSFAVVRNPWERYISLYNYQKSGLYAARVGLNHSHRIATALSFTEWMTFNINSRLRSNWFGVPQEGWCNGVTEVFQMENLNELQKVLELKLRRSLVLSNLNSSEGMRSEASFTRESLEFIASVDSRTIERYNYRPGLYG